jgi:hypothetical protein
MNDSSSAKQNEPHEERSSLLSDSLIEHVQHQGIPEFKFEMVQSAEKPSLFTTAQPEVVAQQEEIFVAQPNVFEMIDDNRPSADLAMSHYEEEKVIPQVVEEEKYEEDVPQIVAEEPAEESSLKLSEPSSDELDKIRYLEKIGQIKGADATLIHNMQYIYDMGYTNFEVNLSLLKRNNNDLIIAINNLCNGLVSESMFQP